MLSLHTKRIIVFGVQYSVNIMGGYRGIHSLSWSGYYRATSGSCDMSKRTIVIFIGGIVLLAG
jgi:hypothetical protein